MTRRFPRSARVRTRAEYDRIFQHGRRVALPVLALHWRSASQPQMGADPGPRAPRLAGAVAGPTYTATGDDASCAAAGAVQPPPMLGAAGTSPPLPRDPAAPDRSANERRPSTATLPDDGGPDSITPAPDPTEPRLGLAVSRKVDRRAVVRNRIKRGLREAFREHRMKLAPGEYVVVARPGAASLDRDALQRALLTLLRRAGALPPVPPAGTMPPAACTDRVQPPSR